jgi:hypothetical protein
MYPRVSFPRPFPSPQDPSWLPRAPNGAPLNGRSLQASSLLAPFFLVTPIPDMYLLPQPDCVQQCFSNMEGRRRGDVESAIVGMRAQMGNAHQVRNTHIVLTLYTVPLFSFSFTFYLFFFLFFLLINFGFRVPSL